MIGGPQGSGINVSADVFAKACVRSGLRVFSNIEYHSNIMGRHSYFRVRVNEKPIQSHVEPVDLLLALDRETLFGDVDAPYQTHRGHVHRLVDGGGIILDAELGVEIDAFYLKGWKFVFKCVGKNSTGTGKVQKIAFGERYILPHQYEHFLLVLLERFVLEVDVRIFVMQVIHQRRCRFLLI